MIANEHPESDVVQQRIDELEQNWDNLKDLSDRYRTQLETSAQAKQVTTVEIVVLFKECVVLPYILAQEVSTTPNLCTKSFVNVPVFSYILLLFCLVLLRCVGGGGLDE